MRLIPDHNCGNHLYQPEEDERAGAIADEFIAEQQQNFTMFVSLGADGQVLVEVNGPTDFVEHGQFFQRLRKKPEWLSSIQLNSRIELPSSIRLQVINPNNISRNRC